MTEFLTSRFKITVSYDVMLDFYSPAFVYKALGYAHHRTRTTTHDNLQHGHAQGWQEGGEAAPRTADEGRARVRPLLAPRRRGLYQRGRGSPSFAFLFLLLFLFLVI